MDQVTQQNAAMVQQSTATSRSLSHETMELSRLVDQFEIDDNFSRRDAYAQAQETDEEPDEPIRRASHETAPHAFAAPSRGPAARLASAGGSAPGRPPDRADDGADRAVASPRPAPSSGAMVCVSAAYEESFRHAEAGGMADRGSRRRRNPICDNAQGGPGLVCALRQRSRAHHALTASVLSRPTENRLEHGQRTIWRDIEAIIAAVLRHCDVRVIEERKNARQRRRAISVRRDAAISSTMRFLSLTCKARTGRRETASHFAYPASSNRATN